jgi:polyisoprenoid-binding protein YceI
MSIMKISMAIKSFSVPFFMVFLILSCNDSLGKKGISNNDEVSTAVKKDTIEKPGIPAKKDSPTKKDVTASMEQNKAQKWNTNASEAQIKFSVKGLFGTVNGKFSGLNSTILFDKDNLAASSIRASVDTKSISTGINLRNHDLQKEKYLDSDKYPVMSFQSDKIQKSETGYKAIGNLTIKSVTKPVEIPFSFSAKGNEGIFKGSFTIQRQDYAVGKPGGSIGSTVTIDLEVPVTK